MLSLQFPVPPTINISFSSHHGNKLLPNKNIIRDAPNNSAKSCNTLINSSLLKFRLAGVPKCATSEIDNQVKTDQIELPEGLVPELMPKHVAIIMDGNRRWAEKRGLPVQLGHRAGGRVIKQLARNCRKHGVQVLTVFTFSTQKLGSPKDIEELIPGRYDITEATKKIAAKVKDGVLQVEDINGTIFESKDHETNGLLAFPGLTYR
ncbi:hypothetical protein DH2020_030295 [Rehmannia glutinosa]|uniref:Alkyl transferase n=1 Tax=Rehmannia glutinosa TaxID=99300 RepID=A0ABR0VPN5_REHGL